MAGVRYTHYIAIDFGTAGCGMVVSTSESETPHLFSGWLPSQSEIKCPTIMLLNHKLECEAFGLKARANYHKPSVQYPEQFNNYYLFEHFKMSLYEEKNITCDMMIKAVDGKELPAIKVFSKALDYMRSIILKYLDEQVTYVTRSILWILTVPAIWSSAAKQVMRSAAENAGFCAGHNDLKFALEPEAASLYCLDEKKDLLHAANGQHLVVDCGGGTVDIAAHKWVHVPQQNKIYVDEIHKVHGGPCGSFAINNVFEKILIELFKVDINVLKRECGSQWSKVIYKDFEKSKCSFGFEGNDTSVLIPSKLQTFIEKTSGKSFFQLTGEYKKYALQWDDEDESIVIPSVVMQKLFQPVVNQIIRVTEEVLKAPECKSVKNIFMVGGFSQSKFLFNAVEKHFLHRATVTTGPPGTSPIYSVLYGSLKFGRYHDMVRSRIMSQTLGIETWDEFVPGEHAESKKHSDGGKNYCKQIFTKFVQVGQSMSTQRSTSAKQVFTPVPNANNACCIRIYGSYEKEPKYVDDFSSYPVGTFNLENLPSPSSGIPEEVTVHMDVRGTEIIVTATNNANKRQLPLKLDWMRDKYIS